MAFQSNGTFFGLLVFHYNGPREQRAVTILHTRGSSFHSRIEGFKDYGYVFKNVIKRLNNIALTFIFDEHSGLFL